ncbi:MAG: aminopeptidase [Eubacteriaceae bacterium]|nr:aminopeptidase [Eubacteriaceae bacterium]
MNEIIKRYKECLDAGKTERECIRLAVSMAEEAGYKPLSQYIENNTMLKPGDKVYAAYNEKTMAMFNIGEEDIEKGMNILGAHVDSPRLDVKQNPFYEEEGMAYMDTHYYGGIKKYQWVTVPLALHGVIVKKDGTKVNVVIGEKDDDPVFAVTDLLIHLSKAQLEKKASNVIEGEKLDLLVGNTPLEGEENEAVKKNMLKIFNERYGVEERDFLSAELEIVPAGKARDMGLDRSMVMAYGQDDRICAFTSLFAMLDVEKPKRTACCLLVDKEEIGSNGASGMHSRFFENIVAEICLLTGHTGDISLRRALSHSKMLSSDVNAAYDPLFPDVFEKKNTAFLSKGLVFSKFTGSGGKSGSNDANAEYIAALRNIMENNDVKYQFAELGRVDAGGGGTIAYITAQYGMEVIDSGLAILCMHATMEISSKADICEAVKGYKAFLTEMK